MAQRPTPPDPAGPEPEERTAADQRRAQGARVAPRARLELLRGELVVHVVHVGSAPVRLGRAAGLELSLTERRVSAHHAVVAWSEDRLTLTDLRSTNGTVHKPAGPGAGESPVRGSVELSDGDQFVLGGVVVVRVRRFASSPSHAEEGLPSWLEDQTNGVRHRVLRDRLSFGAGASCDVVLTGEGSWLATACLYPDRLIELETELGSQTLTIGQPFQVAGRTFVFLDGTDDGPTFTELSRRSDYPYQLEVALVPGAPPRALFHCLQSGREHSIEAENRASLLYLLGSRWVEDSRTGRSQDDRGWVDDEALRVGVWGLAQREMNPNNLQVLLRRLRLELAEAGFDGWCIEKRSGCTRLRVERVVLVGRPEPRG